MVSAHTLEISMLSLTTQSASCHNPLQCSPFGQVCQPAQRKICCRMLYNLRKEEQFCSSGLQQPGSITDVLHVTFTCLVPQFPHGEEATRERCRPDIKAKAKLTVTWKMRWGMSVALGCGHRQELQCRQFFLALCTLQRQHET